MWCARLGSRSHPPPPSLWQTSDQPRSTIYINYLTCCHTDWTCTHPLVDLSVAVATIAMASHQCGDIACIQGPLVGINTEDRLAYLWWAPVRNVRPIGTLQLDPSSKQTGPVHHRGASWNSLPHITCLISDRLSLSCYGYCDNLHYDGKQLIFSCLNHLPPLYPMIKLKQNQATLHLNH